MKIHTRLCYKSGDLNTAERLGIENKGKKYKESEFVFELNDVTGIDAPTKEEPEYFVIFLKGTNGILIKHDYQELMKLWNNH